MNNEKSARSRRMTRGPWKTVASRWWLPAVLLIVTACTASPTVETPAPPPQPPSTPPPAVGAVALPDNPQISGFVIAERFFSEALEAELYEPLGGVENFNRSCDEAAIQAFETKREEILRDLTSGSVEAKTLANMESLLGRARPIRPLEKLLR